MAVYDLPSGRKPATGSWESAGVVGGIPTRSTIFTTINTTGDTTDRSSAINAAITSCPSGQVVKLGAGTFVCTGTISLKANISLRGTVDGAGAPDTLIDARHNGTAIQCGSNFSFNWPPNGATVTVAGLTKGATTIQVNDSSPFSAGQLIWISLGNDHTHPDKLVMNTYGYHDIRSHISKIISVPNSTHVVIDAPGCIDDFTNCPSAVMLTSQIKTVAMGLEDIAVTTINRGVGNTINFPILLDTAEGSWVKNCRIEETDAYSIYMNNCYHCELRHNYCEPNEVGGSTSSAGFLVQFCGFCRIVDNIFDGQPFVWLQEHQNCGNVFDSNFANTGTFNINHNPCNQFTLLEGNVGMAFQTDGYYGGNLYDTMFRNWFMGSPFSSMTPGFSNSLNRFTRQAALVGNILGRSDIDTTGGYSFGNPNLGNGDSNGTAEPSTGSWWAEFDPVNHTTRYICQLTTRTDASHGILTILNGQTFDTAHRTRSAYPSLVAFDPVLFSGSAMFFHYDAIQAGGTQIVVGNSGPLPITLPALNSIFEVWGSPSGYQELDLDVQNTTLLVSNYHGYLASIKPGEGLPVGDTLPASFTYASQPSFFSGLSWPAISPLSPPTMNASSYEIIPAGYRYVHGFDPSSSPAAPVNISLPTTGGSATVGGTMTFTRGSWTGVPSPTLTSILRRCDGSGASCSDMAGETGLTYVPVTGDLGSTIRIRVTATNSQGSATADSAASTAITTGGGGGGGGPLLVSGKPLF